MKKFNFLKIVEILLAVLTAGKAIHDEFKGPDIKLNRDGEGDGEGLPPNENTDPQNPNYPPKK